MDAESLDEPLLKWADALVVDDIPPLTDGEGAALFVDEEVREVDEHAVAGGESEFIAVIEERACDAVTETETDGL